MTGLIRDTVEAAAAQQQEQKKIDKNPPQNPSTNRTNFSSTPTKRECEKQRQTALEMGEATK